MPNVAVTNKNDEPYARKFDGKLYEFPCGKEVTIPDYVAAYLFAYGKTDADRQKIVVRNGWQQNGNPGDPYGPEFAMKRLQKFIFKSAPDDAAVPKKAKVVVPGTLAAPKAARAPGGINAMSDLVDESGNRKRDVGAVSRETIHLPGSKAALAPHLPPA